jgi:hypothetical protein
MDLFLANFELRNSKLFIEGEQCIDWLIVAAAGLGPLQHLSHATDLSFSRIEDHLGPCLDQKLLYS